MVIATPFAFDDIGSVDLQIWMVEDRDTERCGSRVEDTLGLGIDYFKCLIMHKTILVNSFSIVFIGGLPPGYL